jgi:hypothetical protein
VRVDTSVRWGVVAVRHVLQVLIPALKPVLVLLVMQELTITIRPVLSAACVMVVITLYLAVLVAFHAHLEGMLLQEQVSARHVSRVLTV